MGEKSRRGEREGAGGLGENEQEGWEKEQEIEREELEGWEKSISGTGREGAGKLGKKEQEDWERRIRRAG